MIWTLEKLTQQNNLWHHLSGALWVKWAFLATMRTCFCIRWTVAKRAVPRQKPKVREANISKQQKVQCVRNRTRMYRKFITQLISLPLLFGLVRRRKMYKTADEGRTSNDNESNIESIAIKLYVFYHFAHGRGHGIAWFLWYVSRRSVQISRDRVLCRTYCRFSLWYQNNDECSFCFINGNAQISIKVVEIVDQVCQQFFLSSNSLPAGL